MRIRLPLVLIASVAVGLCGCSKRSEEASPAAQTAQTGQTANDSKSNQTATPSGTTTNFESQPAPAAPAPDK